MARRRGILVALLLLASVAGLTAQSGPDRDASWNAFIAWLKSEPGTPNALGAYAVKLRSGGRSDADVKSQMTLIMSQLGERSDWIEPYFDGVYTRPVTGDPATDGFNAQPGAWLVEVVKGLKPGAALDAGMGQGRNAVYLARQGWAVTGFDISGVAVAATSANASRAGVRVDAVKASFDSFDFGSNRWDLIVMTFAWAPVTDPAFVARLRASLRPGGRIVFEHFVHAGGSAPNVTRALKPNELRGCFGGFELAVYEETEGIGDWGGPGSQLVRMVAVKK
jgi:SAM-dependent methyltransferase